MKKKVCALVLGAILCFSFGAVAMAAVSKTDIKLGEEFTYTTTSYGNIDYVDDNGVKAAHIAGGDIQGLAQAINTIDAGLGDIYGKTVTYTNEKGETVVQQISVADILDYEHVAVDDKGNVGIGSVLDDDGRILSVTEAIEAHEQHFTDLETMLGDQVEFEVKDGKLYITTKEVKEDNHD